MISIVPDEEMLIDNFAGGGGASSGIAMALRSPDYAINHNKMALIMHEANHPETEHIANDIWSVDPMEVVKGRPVSLVWFSPSCRNFSRAKAGETLDTDDRDLAWVVFKWIEMPAPSKPRVFMLENVVDFEKWGPIDPETGKQHPDYEGVIFRAWVHRIERAGYKVEWKVLNAADYGAPTTRERFFMVGRCDGNPIVWPQQTHGNPKAFRPIKGKVRKPDPEVLAGTKPAWVAAATAINWSEPCPSIFLTKEEAKATGLRIKRPLEDSTLKRIAYGMDKFVLNPAGGEEPFVVDLASTAPYLIRVGNGERKTGKPQAPRTMDLNEPLDTILAGRNNYALVTPFLEKAFGGETGKGRPKAGPGTSLTDPLGTITTQDHNHLVVPTIVRKELADRFGNRPELVVAFMDKYYGTGQASSLDDPLDTITTKDRFGLVVVRIRGEDYVIVDIGYRMLTARELFTCQGFDRSYKIGWCPSLGEKDDGTFKTTKTNQVAAVGNSCSPLPVAALVKANVYSEMYGQPRQYKEAIG